MSKKDKSELDRMILDEKYITDEYRTWDQMKGCFYILITGAVVLISALIIIFI